MLWNKRIIFFLVLLFLISTFVAVSHHHEDAKDDQDCPVCIAIHHLSASDTLAVVFDGTPFIIETTIVAAVPQLTNTLFPISRSTRGPPA